MKKVLLPFIAACACVTPAFADEVYGTTPETAKPFPKGGWFVESLDNVPAEAWFTIKSEAAVPAQWGDVPASESGEHMLFVYLCDGGQEALQRTEGSDAYVLFPGQEYLVKITPKAVGTYGMWDPMAFPPAWEGLYKYYPKDITEAQNLTQTQAPGSTAWYLYNVSYPSQITTSNMMMPVMDIDTVIAIHNECPGGTNIGSGMMGPYVKAGQNILGVTVSKQATENVEFNFGLNATATLNCQNKILRGPSLTLDVENTYPDAYYTVDRYFKVPEDGTYTFTNHGAKGTILNVGTLNVTDIANFKYECDWTNIKSATVGNSDAVIVVDGLKAGEYVLVQSDAFGVIGEGMENLPYLKVVKGGDAAIDNIVADADGLKVNVAGGNLSVESVLLASGAEVAVYDMLARKVASAVAPEGAASIDMNLDVTPGVYVVVVYGKGNSESAKIAVK